MKIKFPKSELLKKQAFKYNKRAFKKRAIGYIKSISKTLRNCAKSGSESYTKTFTDSGMYSYEIFLAFRWYRRYSGLNVELTEEYGVSKFGHKWISEMTVYIKW